MENGVRTAPEVKPQSVSTTVTEIDAPLNALSQSPQLQQINDEIDHLYVWDEMRDQFHLANTYLDRYETYLRFFRENPNYLERMSKRSKPYLHFILSEVQKRDMPYEIALLPIIESGFRPSARSHQSAVGLWQFIPSTAHLYGLERNWWYDGRQDTIKSTKAALDYLQKLYRLNNNDWLLALASYNAGIGNVYKAVKKFKQRHKQSDNPDYWDIQKYLPIETQNYIPQLLAVSHAINHADSFNIALEPVKNRPYFAEVELKKQISLSTAAKLSNTPEADLSRLNAGFLVPTTPPNGPFNILLPYDKVAAFEQALSTNSELFDIQWIRHKIKTGDSLGVIAEQYKTTRKAIKKLNGMKNSQIRAGKTLLIPVPTHYADAFRSTKQTPRYSGPKKIHTVQPGQSIWSIARYYNISTRTLCHWNNIGVRTPLRKGQQLEIRSGKYAFSIKHRLNKGESLWHVAQKYNVTTHELIRWNSVKKSKTLQPGTLLTVWQPKTSTVTTNNHIADNTQTHKPYKVQHGDNLWNIAKANRLSAKQLALYNNLSLKSFLKPGQVLKIPLES